MHRFVLYVSFNETFFFLRNLCNIALFFFFLFTSKRISKFTIFLLSQVLGFKDTYIWLKDDNGGQEKRGGIRSTKALNSSSKVTKARR